MWKIRVADCRVSVDQKRRARERKRMPARTNLTAGWAVRVAQERYMVLDEALSCSHKVLR